MKIAATISRCTQVSQTDYRDHCTTRIFDQNHRVIDIMHWAQGIDKNAQWCDIMFSQVAEELCQMTEAET